jgi:hypothetical protein
MYRDNSQVYLPVLIGKIFEKNFWGGKGKGKKGKVKSKTQKL